jgi:hypothetical protein
LVDVAFDFAISQIDRSNLMKRRQVDLIVQSEQPKAFLIETETTTQVATSLQGYNRLGKNA